MYFSGKPALVAGILFLATFALGTAEPLAAQGLPDAGSLAASLPAIVGPAAPLAPATITRDDRGGATMRAVRLTTALTIDGRLDESIYQDVQAASGFIQQVPIEGDAATEETELWVFFDDTNLYISARCLDSQPEREVATELRRDHSGLIQNESLSLVLDTFYDRRNGFTFQTGPLGTVRDQAIIDGQLNESWNTVWDVRSSRSERGWSTEMVIPFKSLRYAGSGPQVWGINVRRIVKWKNELSFLTGVPAAYGSGGVNRLNVAATLVGVETPLQSKNLELKPYVTGSVLTRQERRGPVLERPDRGRRLRLQVRAHARPDCRRHGQHRLRAGGRGPAAGEPDAVQPVLSREAGVLSGGARHLRLWRRCRSSHSAGSTGTFRSCSSADRSG